MLEKAITALHNSFYGNGQITQYLQLYINIGADLNGLVQLSCDGYDWVKAEMNGRLDCMQPLTLQGHYLIILMCYREMSSLCQRGGVEIDGKLKESATYFHNSSLGPMS